MTAQEIAETLLNGNIAAARWNLLHDDLASVERDIEHSAYVAATLALDVAAELAGMTNEPGDNTGRALARVRRCLEGAP